MFRFQRKMVTKIWLGSAIILGSSFGFQVKIDVKINEWFGVFYDMIPKALATSKRNYTTRIFCKSSHLITLAGMYIALYVAISFLYSTLFI